MAEAAEVLAESASLSSGMSYLNGLLPALKRLDHLLEQAVATAQAAYGSQAASDPYRGLYLNQDEMERLLTHEPGAPMLWAPAEGAGASVLDLVQDSSRLDWLQQVCGLSPVM
jgi:hypothetical protein